MRCENAWTPGEDTPGVDMYQLYRAADRTSPPAPVIAQAVTPTAASWCATDGGARPWKGCLRAQRDLGSFLWRGMHDPRDARRGSLRTGGLKLIVRPRPP